MKVLKQYAVTILCMFMLISCNWNDADKNKKNKKKPEYLFGYNLDKYKVVKSEVDEGDTFGVIMDKHHLLPTEIYNIVTKINDVFDVSNLRKGKRYTLLKAKDSTQKAQVFIYEHDLINYSIVDFKDSIRIRNIKKPVKVVIRKVSGIIDSSLSETLVSRGVSAAVANELADVYAWTIDFFRVQKDDKFKVIYEQKYINDTIPAGVGKIIAACFVHKNEPFYAFNYKTDSTSSRAEYFDEKAENMKRAFLKAPLKFSRISSRYNLTRRIAFYGKVKPHLGTDFAAPIGSPILSTANGVVVESAHRGGNGNFVKIKHNNNYTTGYLHMSRRKVSVGQHVRQGDVIGWVGMTGNTSGPHVCYRFWKNGNQIDPLKEKMSYSEPMSKKKQPNYFKYIEPIKKEIDALKY